MYEERPVRGPEADTAFAATVLERLRSGDDPSTLIVDEYVSATSDAYLQRVLVRAAIPRRIDAGVLAVLAEPEQDDPELGDRLLSELAALPFVVPHPADGLRYHDSTRDALLLRWRSAEHQTEFRRLSALLADEYKRRFAAANVLTHEVDITADVLRSANVRRYATIRATAEDRVLIAFKETAYHARNAGGERLRDLLGENSGQVTGSPRLTDIVLGQLRRVIREGAARQQRDGDGAPPELDIGWAQYWELRLSLAQDLELADAQPRLERLVADAAAMPDSDEAVRLHLWALAELTQYLIDRDKIHEAAGTCERELELVTRHPVDRWNTANIYLRMATVRRRLDEPSAAIAALGEAAGLAREAENPAQLLAILGAVFDLHLSRGDTEGMRRAAAETLHEVFTTPSRLLANGRAPSEILDSYYVAITCTLALLAERDVGRLDDIIAFAAVLGSPDSGRVIESWALVSHALWLMRRGALERCEQVLALAREYIATEPQPMHRRRLAQSHDTVAISLLHYRGLYADADAGWDSFIAGYSPADQPAIDAVAVARYNQAEVRCDAGWFAAAEQAAAEAQQIWEQTADVGYARAATAQRVRAALSAGNREGAAEQLAQLEKHLAGTSAEISDPYFAAAALLAERGDEYEAAAQLHVQRADHALRRLEPATAVHAQLAALNDHLLAGAWSAAAADAQHLQATVDRLAIDASAALATRETPPGITAALRLFFDGAGDRAHDLRRARDQLAEALEGDPENPWTLTALFYVRSEQGSTRDAERTLQQLAQVRVPWFDERWFAERRAELQQRDPAADVAAAPPMSTPAGQPGSVPLVQQGLNALARWLGRRG